MIKGLGNCSRCGKKINNKTIGDIIGADEVIVCNSCADKHKMNIITNLNQFRLSKEFDSILSLRKKILWSNEELGNWYDSGDKSFMESISDYNNYNIFELKVTLLDTLQTLIENYIYPDLDLDYSAKYPELEKLRLEVRKQQDQIASYINIEEFMKK